MLFSAHVRCTGLLLPGERKSVEPMAARLCPNNVRQTHPSLHHVVAHTPWRDEDILEAVRRYALPAMQKPGPIEAWIVDDTGLVKKGTHSVGVTRAPVAVRELAMNLPSSAWKTVHWREGTRTPLCSRFAALRLRSAHRDYWSSEPRPEE